MHEKQQEEHANWTRERFRDDEHTWLDGTIGPFEAAVLPNGDGYLVEVCWPGGQPIFEATAATENEGRQTAAAGLLMQIENWKRLAYEALNSPAGDTPDLLRTRPVAGLGAGPGTEETIS